MLQRLQRRLVERHGPVVDAERLGTRGRLARVVGDLVPLLAAGEVMDELLGALVEASAVQVLDGGADERVQAPALGLQQRGVGDILVSAWRKTYSGSLAPSRS
jgi:hypothetical protein